MNGRLCLINCLKPTLWSVRHRFVLEWELWINLNVVKCNWTWLTTERCWFSCVLGSRMEWLLSSQRSQAYLLRFTKVTRLRVVAIWNHIGKSLVQPLFSLSGSLFFSGSAFLVFCLPSISPFAFFLSLFPLLSQCDGCLDVPVCGGSWLGCRDC